MKIVVRGGRPDAPDGFRYVVRLENSPMYDFDGDGSFEGLHNHRVVANAIAEIDFVKDVFPNYEFQAFKVEDLDDLN